MSLLQKYKKYKNTKLNKNKKNPTKYFDNEISNHK